MTRTPHHSLRANTAIGIAIATMALGIVAISAGQA